MFSSEHPHIESKVVSLSDLLQRIKLIVPQIEEVSQGYKARQMPRNTAVATLESYYSNLNDIGESADDPTLRQCCQQLRVTIQAKLDDL